MDPLTLQLPKALREISGLTTYQGHLFAIADEEGQIYRIRFAQGRIKKWLAFGQPPQPDDYEGLTTMSGRLYATNSNGRLYRVDDAGQTGTTDYSVVETGLGDLCEIEGLVAQEAQQRLFFLCKTPRTSAMQGKLNLFAWSAKDKMRIPHADIQLDFGEFADLLDAGEEKRGKLLRQGKVYPSAAALRNNELWILAARSKLLLVVSLQGKALRARALPNKKIHRQAEGLVITEEYTFIANEAGKGGKRGTLTRYDGLL